MSEALGNAANSAKEYGQKAVDSAKQYGQQAVDSAKQYGQQALDTAKQYGGTVTDKAKEYGQQASELAHTAGEHAAVYGKQVRDVAAGIPVEAYLLGALGSIGISLSLKLLGRDRDAEFVGHWAPTFLTLGLLSKLIQHDQKPAPQRSGTRRR